MTSRRTALARLVADPDQFLATAFGRVPRYLADADADGFADLLSLDHVDHLVTSSGLRSPSFRLVRDGRTLGRASVTRRARIGSRPVDDLIDVPAVHREFAAGATIVLQGLHRSFAPVAAFCRDLELSLTHPVQANAYLTPPAAKGLHLHADPHDVFAIQTHGVKRWVVHPPDGEPWDLEVHPGDALYLPAGTRHAAQTVDRPSLHLTVGVRTVSWREVLRRAVDEVLADPALDAALPAGWADHPNDLQDGLAERLRELAERLVETDPAVPLAGHAQRLRANRPPVLDGALRDVIEAPTVSDTTPLRRRPALHAAVRIEAAQLHLVLPDRRVIMPAELEPVVQTILTADRFVPKELDELIDEPSRLVLCRRLVREAVLTIDHQARSVW